MDDPLESFLERIASPTPTPGGGTVSAVLGALSASLSRMVANLAVGKKGYEAVQADVAAIETRGKALQTECLSLAAKDARAYEAVVAAVRMPKETDAQKSERKAAIQAAYKVAAEAPLATMRACLEALDLARLAAEKGNKNAVTDAGVAALAAHAGLRGAAWNVKVNLAAIGDEDWKKARADEMTGLLARGEALARQVDEQVAAKM